MTPTAGQPVPPAPRNQDPGKPPVAMARCLVVARSPEQTLRRLFLTLFLRGRSSRGLQKETTPKTVGSKLALTLVFYADRKSIV